MFVQLYCDSKSWCSGNIKKPSIKRLRKTTLHRCNHHSTSRCDLCSLCLLGQRCCWISCQSPSTFHSNWLIPAFQGSYFRLLQEPFHFIMILKIRFVTSKRFWLLQNTKKTKSCLVKTLLFWSWKRTLISMNTSRWSIYHQKITNHLVKTVFDFMNQIAFVNRFYLQCRRFVLLMDGDKLTKKWRLTNWLPLISKSKMFINAEIFYGKGLIAWKNGPEKWHARGFPELDFVL